MFGGGVAAICLTYVPRFMRAVSYLDHFFINTTL